MSENPFESPLSEPLPPTAQKPASGLQEVYVDGNCLVIHSGAALPHRCVRTNVPTTPADETRKELYWASPWIALLILMNILILIIVYFIVRKKCVLTYSESPKLRSARRQKVLIVSLLLATMIVGLIATIAYEIGGGIALTALGTLFTLIALLIVARPPVRIVKHDKGLFWIRGCSREYLEQLLQPMSV